MKWIINLDSFRIQVYYETYDKIPRCAIHSNTTADYANKGKNAATIWTELHEYYYREYTTITFQLRTAPAMIRSISHTHQSTM